MGMEKLLSMSYDRIVSCAEKVDSYLLSGVALQILVLLCPVQGEKMQQELKSRANQLSNATRLMLLLLRY